MMPQDRSAGVAEPILVGARGWVHPKRAGGFYPEELPSDWRFAYYSNYLRSVLVPSETWKNTGIEEVREWVEDSDPEFHFVLELPDALSHPTPEIGRSLEDFLKTVEPIAPQTAGFLLRPSPRAAPDRSWLERMLIALGGRHPLCVDLPPPWRTEDMPALPAQHGAGVCWRPEEEPTPRPGGRLLVALSREGAPRAQRRILEQLIQWHGERNWAHAVRPKGAGHGQPASQWQGKSRRAALFFDTGEAAVEQAKQARLIAELLDA